ncbi:uncharacterized protein LOC112094248 [Morus notabilis]|uniref:uncharacterized protein LOC112094248 n=1 Tax=Morus notabilis TaxID=981085 RepID=UPI000CED3F34|nr:uncharacterized protein LOC112094248 [Morus notabilis]
MGSSFLKSISRLEMDFLEIPRRLSFWIGRISRGIQEQEYDDHRDQDMKIVYLGAGLETRTGHSAAWMVKLCTKLCIGTLIRVFKLPTVSSLICSTILTTIY